MNYERAWVTLKAEIGHRNIKDFCGPGTSETLRTIMDRMEKRINEENNENR